MKTVLVVEDNRDIREMTAMVLHAEGYLVLEAENGREALRILDELPEAPCLILLDLMMPIMDGRAFVQSLREADRLASLPVIIVSATAGEVDGARRFIKKPVPPDVLIHLVEEFCQPT